MELSYYSEIIAYFNLLQLQLDISLTMSVFMKVKEDS